MEYELRNDTHGLVCRLEILLLFLHLSCRVKQLVSCSTFPNVNVTVLSVIFPVHLPFCVQSNSLTNLNKQLLSYIEVSNVYVFQKDLAKQLMFVLHVSLIYLNTNVFS